MSVISKKRDSNQFFILAKRRINLGINARFQSMIYIIKKADLHQGA